MKIPDNIYYILNKINENGFKAYLIGGAVRDLILDIEPSDYDICTNALPIEVISIFSSNEFLVKEEFKDYGVIVVTYKNIKYEITTFRSESSYIDNRHPNKINFVLSLEEDVKRRDYTISSIALNKKGDIIDYYNGVYDINKKTVKCIGNPIDRFTEDPLRILRGLRLVSKYGFSIEDNTYNAMFDLKDKLNTISKEIFTKEIIKIIEGDYFYMICKYKNILSDILEIFKYFDFYYEMIKKNKENWLIKLGIMYYNYFELLEKNEFTFIGKEKNKILRNGLFIAKNEKFTNKMAIKWLIFKYFSENVIKELEFANTIQYHYEVISYVDYLNNINIFNEVKNDCYSLKDLNVNGDDLIKLGINDGIQIKSILNSLLIKVVKEEIGNNYDELIKEIKIKK